MALREHIQDIRTEFPILDIMVHGRPLVYLDSAATSQKPKAVLDALDKYYTQYNSNVHRGVHELSQQATTAYENARQTVANFINAEHDHEIIFTRGTTESINLVASSYCRKYVKPGDAILISGMEHHSNIVPWQIACEQTGANLRVIPIDEQGELKLETLDVLLDADVKLVAITMISNTLGTINPVKEIIAKAHHLNIPVLLDAAQAIQHMPVDVQALDVDFLVFSGHKMYGPTGIGVLYGKSKWLDAIPPYQGGGDMIKSVTFARTVYNELPYKFEAGTPDIAGAIGLAAAIEFISQLGLENIAAYEQELIQYAYQELQNIPGLRFIGDSKNRAGAISFLIDDLHPYDVGELLDKMGVAVRTGHHCTQPIMDQFGIPGTVRASFAVYNTKSEIDILIKSLHQAIKMLKN
ncbi:MAG TPA: cysteine desulfurase [Saprospiraceae bacterium]|nr:cysteine desulfurase [Saprospiraceae bacterium]